MTPTIQDRAREIAEGYIVGRREGDGGVDRLTNTLLTFASTVRAEALKQAAGVARGHICKIDRCDHGENVAAAILALLGDKP